MPGLVRPVVVVMDQVLAEHQDQVAFPGDQQPVSAFGADGAHEAFRIGVGRCRRLHPIQMISTGVSG